MAALAARQTILLADDAYINRALLREVFSGLCGIEEAENGIKAMETLRRNREIALVILDLHVSKLDGFAVLEAMRADPRLRSIPVVALTNREDGGERLRALRLGAVEVLSKPFDPACIRLQACSLLERLQAAREDERAQGRSELRRLAERDSTTGLYNKQTFCRLTGEMLRKNPEKKYILVRWDLDRFKVFNDLYGTQTGDRLLAAVGELYRNRIGLRRGPVLCGRWGADHFLSLREAGSFNPEEAAAWVAEQLSALYPEFAFVPRFGLYAVNDPTLDVALMLDRALLALRSTKGNFAQHYAWYEEPMRDELLEEQELIGGMGAALEEKQFRLYFQPQYDYSSGRLTGAEALVRWEHPRRGVIPPGRFIPLFERNGCISRLDQFVWEQTCRQLRRWLDSGLDVVPVSVNVSRRDLDLPHLAEIFTGLVAQYHLEPAMLHLEITESAYMENPDQLICIVQQLRRGGFLVEMDDFGSGYSSLNMLKSVSVDKLKLDMRFLETGREDSRGGCILNSVVRMAHWLRLPVIAEGVETRLQAEYLKSIGCCCMQGYYFARPMPAALFETVLRSASLHPARAGADDAAALEGAEEFLTGDARGTLLFNSLAGAAAIIERNSGGVEALRMNDSFFQELETTREAYGERYLRLFDRLEPEYTDRFLAALDQARRTGSRSECVVCTKPLTQTGRGLRLRLKLRLLVHNRSGDLYYLAAENLARETPADETQLCALMGGALADAPAALLGLELADRPALLCFNDAAAALGGFTREEYGERFADAPLDAVHPGDLSCCCAAGAELLSGRREELTLRLRHLCADGGWRPVRLTVRVLSRQTDSALAWASISAPDGPEDEAPSGAEGEEHAC